MFLRLRYRPWLAQEAAAVEVVVEDSLPQIADVALGHSCPLRVAVALPRSVRQRFDGYYNTFWARVSSLRKKSKNTLEARALFYLFKDLELLLWIVYDVTGKISLVELPC